MDKKEIFEKAPVHKAMINMALPTIPVHWVQAKRKK